MSSRLDLQLQATARHERECSDEDCTWCTDPDGPDGLSDRSQDERDAREENTRDYWSAA